jgi:hypothetical protein
MALKSSTALRGAPAKREGLEERYPDYVRGIERAMVAVSKFPTAEDAIIKLRSVE